MKAEANFSTSGSGGVKKKRKLNKFKTVQAAKNGCNHLSLRLSKMIEANNISLYLKHRVINSKICKILNSMEQF